MDWSAFAPDRPPGSSPVAHSGLTSPSSPTWPSAGSSSPSSHFSPGQLVGGLGHMQLGGSSSGGGGQAPQQGGASTLLTSTPMYPYATPYGGQQPPSSPGGRAATGGGYVTSSRPRPQQQQPGISTATSPHSPVRPAPSTSNAYPSAASVSPLRTSSRKASLPAPISSSPALPPLPLSPVKTPTAAAAASVPLPTSTSYSSLNGASQTSHASSSSNLTNNNRSSPTRAAAPAKRANPLEDLIATETVYVQDLGVIIKRVAAAWSRTNFPPPQLDSMFRAIEAVYRINKALLAKLLEIGPNPSSPKALGDLLMRWVDDVEPAYTRYATTYALDYDSFDPVQSNGNLAPILAELEWPASLPSQRERERAGVTLDRLFELPMYRVQYYQRLYAKLLRSTQEGRSDHALLVSANEKLAQLEALCEEGKGRSVLPPAVVEDQAGSSSHAAEQQLQQAHDREEDQVEHLHFGAHDVPDPPPLPAPVPIVAQESQPPHSRPPPPRLQLDTQNSTAPSRHAASDSESSQRSSQKRVDHGLAHHRASEESATFDSPLSSESLRSSGATGISTANTSTIQSFSPAPDALHETPLRIEDLERRLNTDRTLDIFTMQPRRCKLQIQPGSLPFQRELRFSADADLSFTPTSDLSHRLVTHPRAHILILTDLFLVCERVAPEDSSAANGADFWLVYPPLAGKHLRVSQQDLDSLEVTIMQKERLVFRFHGSGAVALARDLAAAVQAAAQFGATQAPAPLRQNSLASSAYGHALKSPASSHGHGFDARGPPPPPPGGARPELQLQPLQPPFGLDPSRRVVSGPSVSRPTRGASMAQGGGGLVQSPSASSFQHAARGPSPGPNDERYSLSSSGPRSPYGVGPRRSSQSASDFAPAGDRPDSRQSIGSYSSNRTDSFGRWPEAPPPLPKERTYNGMDISGRGGPLYATSFRGDSLHVPGSSPGPNTMHRARSADALRSDALQQQMHYRMPSQALLEDRASSAPGSSRSIPITGGGAGRLVREESFADVSPPSSPVKSSVPDKTAVVAQMRCKVFLQQHHSVWKSLGTAKLRLFHSLPSNKKQLVVDSDKGGGKTIISTIVLEDGVERVGKTGVAVELSHEGDRTGIVHMLQLKTEQSAVGLFEQLLLGTDRARR
ncbi:hypothetical protein JCM10908_005916 [Rhodotorula pacifica]|uniref:uncharacterized protein n=1 Tax=Rhodotorula pacifica TaxID=1495444 RepID=UPI0031798E9B